MYTDDTVHIGSRWSVWSVVRFRPFGIRRDVRVDHRPRRSGYLEGHGHCFQSLARTASAGLSFFEAPGRFVIFLWIFFF